MDYDDDGLMEEKSFKEVDDDELFTADLDEPLEPLEDDVFGGGEELE